MCAAFIMAGCVASNYDPDAGDSDSGAPDQNAPDSAGKDASAEDASSNDAGTTSDGGANDASANDASANDAAPNDAGNQDAGPVDSGGTPDASDGGSTTVASVAAYVWANDSTSASYTPSTGYSYNSSGGGITITRSGTGSYAVTFANLAVSSGDIQVSAYSSAAHCNVTSWGGSTVYVACYDHSGAAVDSMYTVAVVLNDVTSVASYAAYAWANDSTSASYTPSGGYSYNSAGGAITATRSGTGSYAMTFGGLSLGSGDVQVSAYNSNASCNIGSWGGSTVYVRCWDHNGAAVDSVYTVSVILNNVTSPAKVVGYAWASSPSSASYTPSTLYSFNSSGQGITATRSGAGTYAMTFTGLAFSSGDVKVSAYSSSTHCNVSSWGGGVAYVKCYDASNTLTDAYYTVVLTE